MGDIHLPATSQSDDDHEAGVSDGGGDGLDGQH